MLGDSSLNKELRGGNIALLLISSLRIIKVIN